MGKWLENIRAVAFSRKQRGVLVGAGIVTVALALLGVGAGLVRCEPGFYRRLALPPGEERKQHSDEFTSAFVRLLSGIVDKSQWYGHFTAEQINSYFMEDFTRNGTMDQTLPDGIHDPRIALDQDKVRLAFRYGKEPWSTIMSIDMRVWLVPKEYNVVALELQGMRAGLLPISAQSILERLSEAIRKQNRSIDVTWYRLNGNPVALIRFQADKPVPTIHLQRLELTSGEMKIWGCAVEAMHLTRELSPASH